MNKLKIVYKHVDEIIPYVNNPRNISQNAINKVASSIKNFGFKNPVIIDKDNEIVAGHNRILAAKKLGMEEVPCIVADDLTEAQIKAFRIADNKTSEFAEWDMEMLKVELEGLEDEFTGFDFDELDELDDLFHEENEAVEDDFDEEPPEEPISKRGDIWLLGRHRLMCGDATKKEDVERLMDGKKADMLFTDPPYGVSVVGSNGSIGKGCLAKEGTYRPVIGDDRYFNPTYLLNIGEKQIIWGANYFHDNLPLGTRWLVWDKERPDGTTFSDCELAWTSIKGVAVKKYKCTWHGMIREGESEKRVHPTQKPLKLCCEIIKDYTDENDIVLDLFGGSGSTLIACEQINRICYMMELDEKYVDVIVNRYISFKESDEDVFLIRDGVQIPYKEVKKLTEK